MKTADSQAPGPEPGRGGPDGSGESPATALVRLRLGDVDALGELLERHWESCVLYARSLVGGRDAPVLAEDLAQEAFVQLWQHRSRLTSDTAPLPYLFRIIRNLALNEERRLGVRTRLAHRTRESLVRPNPTPAQELEAGEAGTRAREAVEALPPRRREVFLLVRVQGLSYREVAETMGISRQTVANQMSTALDALREALDPWL